MKRILGTLLLSIVALTLIAQPVAASQSPMFNPQPIVLNQSGYDGVDKFQNTWYGFKLYLSKSTLLWLGAGIDIAALTAMLVNLAYAPLAIVVVAIVAIMIGLGAAFFMAHSVYNYGIVMTFVMHVVPFPLLIDIDPQPAPSASVGSGPPGVLPTGGVAIS